MANTDPLRETEGSPIDPNGDAVYGRDDDLVAGSGDASQWENVPSGEMRDAAEQPQNAAVPQRAGGDAPSSRPEGQ